MRLYIDSQNCTVAFNTNFDFFLVLFIEIKQSLQIIFVSSHLLTYLFTYL